MIEYTDSIVKYKCTYCGKDFHTFKGDCIDHELCCEKNPQFRNWINKGLGKWYKYNDKIMKIETYDEEYLYFTGIVIKYDGRNGDIRYDCFPSKEVLLHYVPIDETAAHECFDRMVDAYKKRLFG